MSVIPVVRWLRPVDHGLHTPLFPALKAEVGGSLISWSAQQAPDQPELHSETKKPNQTKNQKAEGSRKIPEISFWYHMCR